MKEKKPIKLNDQQLMLMASNVSDIYHQLSNDLFDNVVDRLKERGTYYLEKEPYLWQLEKMNSIGMLNDQNVRLMAEYSGIAEEQIRYIIENEGYKVYTDTMEQLGSNEYDNRVMEDLISYSNQAINDVTNLINTTLPKSVIGAYQGIIEKTIAKVVTGMTTAETALNETIMEWHAKGFYGYTDRAGRRQRADSYARTVINTTVARVNNEMRTRPAEELGIDTFYYSIKAAAREMCAPIQHQIVTTGDARREAGHKIYALSDYGYGRPEGCRGINCNHIMTPFIPGVNYLPEIEEHLKDLTPEQAIKNANAQAKQRALERSIRFTKEQIHVAEKLGDMELIDRYKMKLGNQKHALKSFLDEHKFLYRDRDREKYYEDPLGVAKEEIRQRKILNKHSKSVENHIQKLYNQGMKNSGAIYGAWNAKNDPDEIHRKRHAELYYESVRNRSTVREVARIAKHTGFAERDVQAIYDHVFENYYELEGGSKRFDPDYDMAQSWDRLFSGKDIQKHDITLLHHELMESKLMAEGMNYDTAHKITQKKYDYLSELIKWQIERGDL
ncbi:TPA: phage minor capsid protein [Streptococcus suis]